MTNQPLSLFISSKMKELIEERRAVQAALSQYHMLGWLWEKDAGARPESIHSTYLKEVEACDLYIGLFWLGYGPYTIEEFEHARQHNKPCLIYEKHVDVDQRDPRLQTFLSRLGRVDDGLTVCRFETTDELAGRVQEDVVRLLTDSFHQKQQGQSRHPQMNVTATNKSIAFRDNYGTVIQRNYANAQPDDKQE